MNNYITGAAIKRLREERGMTQNELAKMIGVSGKAVSKWETAKGLPDISLIEPLSPIPTPHTAEPVTLFEALL